VLPAEGKFPSRKEKQTWSSKTACIILYNWKRNKETEKKRNKNC
jgi:hypothetical protein